MGRALLILSRPDIRAKAKAWIDAAPDGSRIEFKAPRRTLDQNSRLWAVLTDIASQAEHHGRKYPAETWKFIFLSALGREMQFVPALDGHGMIPIGQSSSDLSKTEMSALLELMEAWASEHNITLHAQDIV